jgi:MarR family transcriptional regulator, negative regulator of the multidrug operon emrRAB
MPHAHVGGSGGTPAVGDPGGAPAVGDPGGAPAVGDPSGAPAAGDPRRAPPPSRDLARGANLLGAVSLAVADRIRAAAERGAAQGGSAPAALVSLAGYLDGSPIDAVRGPLGLTHSATVRVVDRLVAAGLARRREGPDRRSVAVELTQAGRGAAAEAARARAEALEEALAALDPGERAELARLHAKVLATLTDGRATAGHICRLCDSHACGHEEGRCPVTQAADAAEARREQAERAGA